MTEGGRADEDATHADAGSADAGSADATIASAADGGAAIWPEARSADDGVGHDSAHDVSGGGPPPPAIYAELHCHSTFSLLDGASQPEALVARARRLGYAALALTDHDDLGGMVRFGQAAEEVKLPGIVGVELTVLVPAEARGVVRGDASDDLHATHLVLLAEDAAGYANLSTLVTRARLDRPRGAPGVPLDVLARHARGLVALTGCPRGWVPTRLRAGDAAGAWAAACRLREIFDDRLRVECWDHGLPEERHLVRELVPLARRLGVPWLVAGDAHYAEPSGQVAHDVLCALRHGRPLDAMGTRLRPNGEWHLQRVRRLQHRWRHDPGGLRATLDVADRCGFRVTELRPSLPAFPLPPETTADEYLAALVEAGARERWDDTGLARTPAHDRQLRHELALIRRLGLAGYFLIVWDIVRFARREGILCQGRGSAANSAVCYCLGITAVDPVRMGLLFERFLSGERREMPDIDLDFAHRDRERVLQYVYDRYGREHAAMVCEHITWRGRSAVRDAARALGFSPEQAAALSTLSDRFSAQATAAMLRQTAGRRPTTGEEERLGAHATPAARPSFPSSPANAASAGVADPVAHALASGLVRGTEATTRANAVKREARQAALTSRDRPRPSAAYEPYGSPNAQDTARPGAAWLDPHADDSHTERRNPTTALLTPRAGDASDSVLARAGLDPDDRRVRLLADVVEGLHQAPRHRSIHVGGFVLTGEPLASVVPIEPAAMPGRTVIQWEKDDLDPVRLVKIDLLGLGMLTLLQDCLKYLRATRGVSLDLGALPMDDPAVYEMLCRADTIGVFQVESRAQQNTLPRLKPRCFYDLVVEVALIRPGPIQGDMVHPYLRRRAGVEAVTYPHPSLEPILERTLGIPLFQEQGMQVAIACAGFSPGEADELRRAMGHKRSRERMAELCERLVAGMARNGIPEDTARRIYNQINAFADYGFPESHAASFALLVYASAYLKHHYAPEFTAALLNAQPMGFYSPGTIVEDARRHGVEVRPVDLTRSGWDHSLEIDGLLEVRPSDGRIDVVDRSTERRASSVEGRRAGSVEGAAIATPNASSSRGATATRDLPSRATEQAPASESRSLVAPLLGMTCEAPACLPASIDAPRSPPLDARRSTLDPALRLGLRAIRGLGAAARARLQAALADGPFASVADVVRRTGLDRRALRLLAEAGAFDAFFAELPVEERRRAALWALLEAQRGSAGPLAPLDERTRPALPAMVPFELTAADYRLTSLSLNGHPMCHLRPTLAPNGVHTARELLVARDGERAAMAGLVICRQRPGTAKGFVFLTLEDETGCLNVVVTPKRFERQALLISTSPLLLVRGTLQVEGTVVNLRGATFRALVPEIALHARSHDFH